MGAGDVGRHMAKSPRHQLTHAASNPRPQKRYTMTEESLILKKYNEAFLKFNQEAVIDMDKKQLPKLHFAVYRLEERLKELNGIVPTNRDSNYYIAFIKKGQGTKTIGFSRFQIVDHTLMVIPARVIHGGEYTSPDYSGYVLGFTLEYFINNRFPAHLISNKLIFRKSLRPYIVLDNTNGSHIQSIYEELLKEYSNRKDYTDEMIALKILELAITVDRLFAEADLTGATNTYPELIERFNDLLDENFTQNRSVKYYADALNVHPNTLNTLVKKYSGRSAKETIISKIMMEAKYHLTQSSLSVKEVAHLLGFDDPNYFSYFFKKTGNISPGDLKSRQ